MLEEENSKVSVLDADAFRRELAKLAEPTVAASLATAQLRDLAVDLCVALAVCYNRDVLEPVKLWDRIGSGLAAACHETVGTDLDQFVSLCLEHVRAELSRMAAQEGVAEFFARIFDLPDEDRRAFLEYVRVHRYAVIVHGRSRWEALKKERL